MRSLKVLFTDAMLDLDKPVKVLLKDLVLHDGPVPRTVASLHSTLADRGDPRSMFEGSVTVSVNQ